MAEEGKLLGCLPKMPFPQSVTPGSTVGHCDQCGCEVWISPGREEFIRHSCIPCVRDHLTSEVPLGLTPELRSKLEADFRRPLTDQEVNKAVRRWLKQD